MGKQIGDHEEQLSQYEHADPQDRTGADAADWAQKIETRAEIWIQVHCHVHTRTGEESLLYVKKGWKHRQDALREIKRWIAWQVKADERAKQVK